MSKKLAKGLPLLLIVIFALSSWGCGTQVPSGHRGVFYSKFGDGTEFGNIYPEGFAWHLPWNSMFVYRTQVQERKESLTVLSSDGASIRLEVSILYRPDAGKIDSLQVEIGPNYYNDVVAPNLRGIARGVAGRYKPEEIYSTKRDEMAASILSELTAELAMKWVAIENVLVRDVVIPAKISEAINFKLTADQEAQKMQFTIEKEKLEAERKRIEAGGIADFQKIVSAGITNSYLKWKGIEATQRIAESPNSKVIMVGNSSEGMPVILSADK
ncbi:MAG: prohibitin family protein [bacterium]|nr:prohibitin family protein [bacterium]